MSERLVGLAHIGIYIRDPEVSKDFYINKLHFELKAENVLGNGTRLIFLDAGTCQLELICSPKNRDKIPSGVVNHICIECKDIEQWVENLKAQGVPFESDTIGCMPDLLGGVKNIFFAGPDGERFEFFEYLS